MTGGGTGLGRGTALELARCGASVMVVGRREEPLRRTVEEIRAEGGSAEGVAGDVRTPEEAARLVQAALGRYGRLDVLVNNAGGQYFTPAEAIAAKGWRAVWRLNVDGTLHMAHAAYELAMEPARRRDDRQRHALTAPRDAWDGALGRGARGGRGAHAGTRWALGRGGRQG